MQQRGVAKFDTTRIAETVRHVQWTGAHLQASKTVARASSDTVPDGSGAFAYEVAVLERKPELVNKSEVAGLMQRLFPRMLRDAGIRGTTMMQFVIEADGSVNPGSIKVIDSTHEQFADASAKAVEKFRFRAGQLGGRSVRTIIQMPITWQPPDRPVPEDSTDAAARDAITAAIRRMMDGHILANTGGTNALAESRLSRLRMVLRDRQLELFNQAVRQPQRITVVETGEGEIAGVKVEKVELQQLGQLPEAIPDGPGFQRSQVEGVSVIRSARLIPSGSAFVDVFWISLK